MSHRRFFCEVCKVTMDYTRNAIQDHNNSVRHKKLKKSELDTSHMKAKMLKMTPKEKFEYFQ